MHELLTQNGLDQFYKLQTHPGVRVKTLTSQALWGFLDEPTTQSKLLDFTDGKTSRVTFHIPAIHCVACVWLLENLFRILPGAGASQVNFPRREVSISFANHVLSLSRLVEFLVSIGYEPELNFGQLDTPRRRPTARRLWLQIGLAGFAFGNIMLFSLPGYLGLDAFSGPSFQRLFRYLSPGSVRPRADLQCGGLLAFGLAILAAAAAHARCADRGGTRGVVCAKPV